MDVVAIAGWNLVVLSDPCHHDPYKPWQWTSCPVDVMLLIVSRASVAKSPADATKAGPIRSDDRQTLQIVVGASLEELGVWASE
jgi:hypothetical protein